MTTTAIPLPMKLKLVRDLVMPKEHGSWSLAFEPVALGCLVAPSVAGGWLVLAIVAGFFARRPLRSAVRERDAARRASASVVLAVLSMIAIGGLFGVAATGGMKSLLSLGPSAVAGAGFLAFDLRNAGREQFAEVLGALTFGWVPAVFAALAGWSPLPAVALAVLMIGRAVPAVLVVRTCLRANKNGTWSTAPALIATGGSLVASGLLYACGVLPLGGLCLLAALAARTLILIVFPRPILRARSLGMMEAILGAAFVSTAAFMAW